MSYVIASYTITAVILLAYGFQLARERKALGRGNGSLGQRDESPNANGQIPVDSHSEGEV